MKKKIGVVVCLHGTEVSGLEVKDKLDKKLSVFIGNPKAIKMGVRFIDSDLNRVFPGDPNGNTEERLASDLLKKLKDFDHIIDLHTSACDFPLFGIITKPTKEKIEFAKKLGLRKLVIMTNNLAKGGALIDYVKCSISLEVGPHSRLENAKDFMQAIENLLQKQDKKMNIYEVYNIVPGEKNTKFFMKNFKKVKKGTLIAKGKTNYFAKEDFVPIFVGKTNYNGYLCLAAKKVGIK